MEVLLTGGAKNVIVNIQYVSNSIILYGDIMNKKLLVVSILGTAFLASVVHARVVVVNNMTKPTFSDIVAETRSGSNKSTAALQPGDRATFSDDVTSVEFRTPAAEFQVRYEKDWKSIDSRSTITEGWMLDSTPLKFVYEVQSKGMKVLRPLSAATPMAKKPTDTLVVTINKDGSVSMS